MITEDIEKNLQVLQEKQIISSAEKNLRSKIDSILRSLENLSEKKLRIEFEIKRQKKSLIRKRAELKRVSSTSSKKLTLAIENKVISSDDPQKGSQFLRVLDNKLLQESSRVLED